MARRWQEDAGAGARADAKTSANWRIWRAVAAGVTHGANQRISAARG
jgi:hypothetical protein